MSWTVRRRDVDYFVTDLWKDVRPFVSNENEFGKGCFSTGEARFEADVLDELGGRLGYGAVPQVHRVEGSVIYMERVRGVRLFDLVRHLRSAEEYSPSALEARTAVLANARERLRLTQLALADMTADGSLVGLTPYPLELKVRQLLEFFIRVLGIANLPPAWRDELAVLDSDWAAAYAQLPFRDATAKNIIARIDPVEGADNPSEDMEAWLRSQVRVLLAKGADYWSKITLTGVDFSSVGNLTSPEDDPLSLYFHEGTAGTIPLTCRALVLDPALGSANPARAALTLFVRYLRFGGRKLAYRLINAQGFAVRFAYDHPLYYFDSVRAHATLLDPTFEAKAEHLLQLMEAISRAVRAATPQDEQIMRIDQVRRFGYTSDYWQQTPYEGGGS